MRYLTDFLRAHARMSAGIAEQAEALVAEIRQYLDNESPRRRVAGAGR